MKTETFACIIFLVFACRNSGNSSGFTAVPDGCNETAFRAHLQRKAAFDNLDKTLQAATKREPMGVGEAVKSSEISGVTVHRASVGFVVLYAHFSKQEQMTRVEMISDAIDPCYQGLSYGEFKFSDQHMSDLMAALDRTTRLDEVLPACPGRIGSNPDLITLYFMDGTFTDYLVKRAGSCQYPDESSLPVLSEDFFAKQAELRAAVKDESSPYIN